MKSFEIGYLKLGIPLSFELWYSSFLILISFLLPAYLIRFSVAGIPTTLLEVAIWAAVLIGIFQAPVRRSWVAASQALPKPILIAIAIFLVSAIVSTVISPHLETSLGVLKAWIVTPLMYAFLVYAAGIRVSKALIFSGLAMALFSFSQIGQVERIRGIYDVPNSLALFLAPLILLAFFSAKSSAFWRTRPNAPKGFGRASFNFYFLAAGVMFLALLFTQSLAGVLSVVVVVLFGLLVIRKLGFVWDLGFGIWKFLLSLIVLTVIAAAVLVPKITYLIQPQSSAGVRLQLWSVSWDLIREHPLLGVGLGTFEPAYQQKLHERFIQYETIRQHGGPTDLAGNLQPLPEFVFRDPHNWILSFWLNLGLFGLLSFAFLNGYALWKSARAPITIALLTLLIFGLVDTVFWKNDLATLHFLLIALLLRSPGSEAQ